MHGKVNKRLDRLLFLLIKMARDKAFDRIVKLSRGKAKCSKLLDVAHRHKRGQILGDENVRKLGEVWIIKSEDGTKEYEVTADTDITSPCCNVICQDCNICIHMYNVYLY